jgi:lipopolysaccharide transport system permease protein
MRQAGRKLIIEEERGHFNLDWAAAWEYRELLYMLILRDIKVRYKQTAIGVVWVVLQPVVSMLIFTAIFWKMVKVPSDGIWYPAFALCALLPWTYFTQALTRSGASLVGNANMITKVYFPRLLLPLATILAPLIDLVPALVILFGLMVFAGIPLTVNAVALPGFILLAVLTAAGPSLLISSANVRYRDVGHAIPFLVQTWLFLSPIAYPVSVVPEQWRVIYGLNPMVGVIEGFRWALLGKEAPDVGIMAASYGMALLMLIAGAAYFRMTERQFADVI